MSKPRPIVPGEVVSVTRRTVARKFLLRPDEWVGEVFGYLLAHYAAMHDVGVVAAIVMSNHYHLMVVDRSGRLPELMNALNAAMARAVNAMREREGAVWDAREPHYQVMLDPAAALSMAAYDLANPVAAGLVEHGREWPGFRTTANGIGRAVVYRRPAVLDGEAGTYPATATLELVAPTWSARRSAARGRWWVGRTRAGRRRAGRRWVGRRRAGRRWRGRRWVGRRWRGSAVGGSLVGGSAAAAAERFGQELAVLVGQREAAARARVRAAGRRFAGRAQVLATDWNAEATSDEERGGRRPTVAGSDDDRRREYLAARRLFVDLHDAAKRRFVDGVRDVVFPFGTWMMRVIFRAQVAEAPG
ncbi:MAG: hypothetical protein U1F43_33660 [Myxococcota bacterium]